MTNLDGLVCEWCKLILEDPVTLACGNTLCLEHLKEFNKKFNCYFCKKEHQIPDDGLMINKTINIMINNFYNLNPLREKIKISFNKLDESIQDYEDIDPECYVFDYFGEIRSKVDLNCVRLKKEIDSKSGETMKKLKELENKCKLNLADVEKENLDDLKNNNLPSWKQTFREPNVNQDQLNDLYLTLNRNVKMIRDHKRKLKNNMLDNHSIKFRKYERKNWFGQLKIDHIDIKLSTNCGRLIREYKQHSDAIRSIQVDEKLNKLITASEDNTINVWNLETGKCLKTLKDHTKWVTCISMISNDEFISGSKDKTIKIWDLNSYKCLDTLTYQKEIYSMSLLPNNQLAIGHGDGSICILDIKNRVKVKSFKAHDKWIQVLKLFEYTKLISCSGYNDNKIKIWNIETFECVKVIESYLNTIFNLELTANGNLLSCSYEKIVEFRHIESGELLESLQFDHPVKCIKTLNDELVAIGLQNGHIIIYDLNRMKEIKIISTHSSFIYNLVLLSNGNLLSGSGEGDIKLWKLM